MPTHRSVRKGRSGVKRKGRSGVKRSVRKGRSGVKRSGVKRSVRKRSQYIIPQQHLNNLINQSTGQMPMVRPRTVKRGSLTSERQRSTLRARNLVNPQEQLRVEMNRLEQLAVEQQRSTARARNLVQRSSGSLTKEQMAKALAPPPFPPRPVPNWAQQPAVPRSGHGYVPFDFYGKNPTTGL